MCHAKPPIEGDIYKIITVSDKTFVLRYGYYSDSERDGEPMPIMPDFEREPFYDKNGKRFVTRIQDACQSYCPRDGARGDGWCADCSFYPDAMQDIGICQCETNGLKAE